MSEKDINSNNVDDRDEELKKFGDYSKKEIPGFDFDKELEEAEIKRKEELELMKKAGLVDEETEEEKEKRIAIGIELHSKVIDIFDNIKAQFYRTISRDGFIEIDFSDIILDPVVANSLLDNYDDTQNTFDLVVSDVFSDTKKKLGKDIDIRFKNIPDAQEYNVYQLRSHLTNQLIKIKCVIRSCSAVMTRVEAIRWECNACGSQFTMLQFTKKPKKARCKCGSKSLRAAEKITKDIQTIEIEELPENIEGIQQSMQRKKVLIQGTLTDPTFSSKIQPGNRVELIGTLIETPLYFRDDKETNLITHMFLANNIKTLEMEYESVELEEEDIKKIEEEAKDPHVFLKLRDSIAPEIYGLNDAKQALILQAVEGVEKKRESGFVSRGKIHVALIGEPSTGKSKLLETMYEIAPKARYTVGGGTTRAGVTAGAVKDENSKQWVLEAGAMVLAHKGLFILDEADKMSPEDSGSLHEGMAQGSITKTVSGVNARLPANCSVLIAANPKYSRFDRTKPIGSQIEMPVSLLSRFDVIFPVFDNPGEIDEKIGRHILTVHRQPSKIEPPYSMQFVRKYLSYAKQKKPKLTKEVEEELLNYYTDLRQAATRPVFEDGISSPIPITPRQLEALIRLAEASAKIRLDDYVRKQDADRAKSIFISCMEKVGIDSETGTFDIDMISSAVAASDRKIYTRVLNVMKELTTEERTMLEDTEIIGTCQEKFGIGDERVARALEKLSEKGEIFEPKRGKWSLLR